MKNIALSTYIYLVTVLMLFPILGQAQEDRLLLSCKDKQGYDVDGKGRRTPGMIETKPTILEFDLRARKCPYNSKQCTITDTTLQFYSEPPHGYTFSINRVTGDFRMQTDPDKDGEYWLVLGSCQKTQQAF